MIHPRGATGLAYERGLRRFATAERLPALYALPGEGLFSGRFTIGAGEEDEFMLKYGIQRFLDGDGTLIDHRFDPTGCLDRPLESS